MGKESKLKKIIKENKIKPYKRNTSKISAYINDKNTETLYIGSRKRNSNAVLRIYDKKKEQME